MFYFMIACSNYENLIWNKEQSIANLTTSINEETNKVETLYKLLHQHGIAPDGTAQIDYRDTIHQLQEENKQLITNRDASIHQYTIQIQQLQNDNNNLLSRRKATGNELSGLKDQIAHLESKLKDYQVTLSDRNNEQASLMEQHREILQNKEQQYNSEKESRTNEINTLIETLSIREQEILTLTTQLQTERAELQTNNTELNESVVQLTANMNTQQETMNKLQTALNTINESNTVLKIENNSLKEQLNANSIALQKIEREKDDITINNTQLRDNLNAMKISLMAADEDKQRINGQLQSTLNAKASLSVENGTLIKRLEELDATHQPAGSNNMNPIELLKEELLNKESFIAHLQQRIATLEPTVKWRGASSDNWSQLKSINEQIIVKERELAISKTNIQCSNNESAYLDTQLINTNRHIQVLQELI